MLKEHAEAIRGQVVRMMDFPMSDSEKAELRRTSARLERISKGLSLRPCTAIYGQSQVGKSYLVNRVLAKEGKPIYVKLGEHRFDFINQINPVGKNQEATGVVTRFTTTSSLDDQHPVQLRLFRPIEVIQILVDGFMQDVCNQSQRNAFVNDAFVDWTPSSVPNNLDQDFITTNELQEFEDFCERSGLSVPNEFWLDTRENLGKLNSQVPKLIERFKVLWGNREDLSRLGDLLLKEYQGKGLTEKIRADVSAILRERGGIVDVKALQKWFNASEDVSVGCLVSGERVEIRCSILAALTKEVVLSLDSENTAEESSFIQSTDFLDFPGARASLNGVAITKETDLYKPFLRAKVRHLFRSYAVSMEIENLLWCWNGANMDAVETPNDVSFWMESCIGRDLHERSKYLLNRKISPLACVHTWFNVDMTMMDKPSDVSNYLGGRFGEHFKGKITGKVDWFDGQWSLHSPYFDEIHFLRDPTFSKELFSGRQEKDVYREKEILPEKSDHFDSFFELLSSNEVISKHCRDLDAKWEGISRPNAVGSDSILHFLNEASQKSGIEVRMCSELSQIKKTLLELLSSLTQSEDLEEQLNEAERKARVIKRELLTASMNFGIRNRNSAAGFLDSFENLIEVTSAEVMSWHSELAESAEQNADQEALIAAEFLATVPGLTRGMSQEERLSYVANFLECSVEEAKDWVRNQGVDLSKLYLEEMLGASHRIVQGLLGKVAEEKLAETGDAFMFLKDCGVQHDVVASFFSELTTGLEERALGARVSGSLDEYYKTHSGVKTVEPHVVSKFIAFWWNEFIFKCDHRFFDEAERAQLRVDLDDARPASLEGIMNDILGKDEEPKTARITAWYNSIRNIASANTNAIEVDRELMLAIRERKEQLIRIQLICDE